MAADRTLMAWIRTALSMISFGFTICKFHQYLLQTESPLANLAKSAGERPSRLGPVLIVLGLISLAIGCLQDWYELKLIEPRFWSRFRPSLVVAVFVALIGALALLNVLFRIGPL
jgi:putative membrane protein